MEKKNELLGEIYNMFIEGNKKEFKRIRYIYKTENNRGLNQIFIDLSEFNKKQTFEKRRIFDDIFILKNIESKRYVKNIYGNINNYKTGERLNYDSYVTKKSYILDLKRFSETFTSYSNEIDLLFQLVEQDFKTKDEQPISIFNIKNSCCKNLYFFEKLLKCESLEESRSMYRRLRFTRKKFNYEMQLLRDKNIDKNEILKLINSYNDYIDYQNIESSADTITKIEYEELLFENKFAKIKEIISSEYSIEEYCFKTGENINKIKKMIESTKTYDIVLYRQINELLNYRENENLFEVMRDIVAETVLNSSFDYLSFRFLTKMKLDDFYRLMISSENFSEEEIAAFGKFKNIETKNETNSQYKNIKEDICLNAKISINNEVATLEEKQQVIDLLKKNGIKLNDYCFFKGVSKLKNGELTNLDEDKVK